MVLSVDAGTWGERMPASAASFARDIAHLTKGPLTFYAAGEGPDVLCLHPAAGLEIRSVAHRLARSHRVWLPIVPGYDKTPLLPGVDSIPAVADVMAEFIDKMMRGPAHVVGHSMGARLGAWLTVRSPTKVAQLVLMAPSGFRPVGAPPVSFEPATFLKQLYAHPEKRPPETCTPEERDANRKAFQHYGGGAPRDTALDARIGEIEKPTLLVQGACDVRVPPESTQELHGKIRNSTLVCIDDAAHALEVDQPERVADVVVSFIHSGLSAKLLDNIAETV
jgi:pimeloyl-ACP methyl ester carboxylesterase